MKILVSGSHGLIGTALVDQLEVSGHQVSRLVRAWGADGDILWNPLTGDIDVRALEGFDVVIHLGGENIGEKRWTERVKERVWNSRTNSTEILTNALASLTYKPQVFLCASAVGFYGSRGEEPLTEKSSQGQGYLADLVGAWEFSSKPAADAGIRLVSLRSGVVLSDQGGSLPRQATLFRSWVGGPMGSGKQWLSWVSLRDEVNAIIFCMEHEEIRGPVNIVAPNPAANVEFAHALAIALRRPAAIPSPRWMLKLALGEELVDEVVLTSQFVIAEKLTRAGFVFQDTDIHDYLLSLYQPDEIQDDEDDQRDQDATNGQSGTEGNGNHSY